MLVMTKGCRVRPLAMSVSLGIFALAGCESGADETVPDLPIIDVSEGPAFPLAFDRIENRKTVTLRTRAPLAEARAFQAALVRHLLACRAPIMLGTTPEPHVTINYRGDRLGSQKMPPIGWLVEEIILMESIVGKTTHVEHGRWPLRAAGP